ncbi:MAG: gamma-glutamylcyclotransferase family protein [Flavisolibacter sp.]
MKSYLFSYGTLQKAKVQMELFGRLLKGEKDNLPGYRLETIAIKDEKVLATSELPYHLIAVPGNENDFVEGVVLELTQEEIESADAYETEDYKRIEVQLKSGKTSWVYVAV